MPGRFGSMVYGTGRAQVTISQEHARAFEAVLDYAIPELAQTMTEVTTDIVEGAEAEWPVKSGFSKRRLNRGIRIEGSVIEAFVRNLAKYSYFIRWGVKSPLGRRVGGRVANDLIYKPGMKRADEVAAATADALADLASRG